MTELAKALRRVRQRTQISSSEAPRPYSAQPRLPRYRKLFTPFEVWLAVMAACMAQTGALALVWAVQG